MTMFAAATRPQRRDVPELLDQPALVLDELPGNLADIRFLNRWFGGTAIALRHIRPLLSSEREVAILDVATGSGDIPLAVVRWGATQGKRVRVTGLDSSGHVLGEARRFLEGSDVTLVEGDARALPWEPESFDIVTCCLALHHFPQSEAIIALREMYRVARSAIVVTDLSRSYAAYAGTWLVTRTLARNVVTRHDGPLSVLRAYTPSELREMAGRAGFGALTVHSDFPFRMTLVARKSDRA